MSKRLNPRVDIDADLRDTFAKVISSTGWSASRTVNVLLRAGLLATTGDPKQTSHAVSVEAIRQMIAATIAANSSRPAKIGKLL